MSGIIYEITSEGKKELKNPKSVYNVSHRDVLEKAIEKVLTSGKKGRR